MTREEYQRICARLARKAIRYASEMAEDKDPSHVTSEREHWIDVYLDEYLPDIDPGVLLSVTSHADAYEKSSGQPASSHEIAAVHAFQADVWDAITRMETTAPNDHDWQATATWFACRHCGAQAPAPHAGAPTTGPCPDTSSTRETPRPLVTIAEHVTGLELRVAVKLLGYVIEHYTGLPENARAVAAIKAREVEAVAAELLKDRGWEKAR